MTEGRADRLVLVTAAIAFIVLGLSLRLLPLGLPIPVMRHGGNIAWGAMVFCLLGASIAGLGRMSCLGIASVVSVGSELFRLYHAPPLDAFRGTLAGALLLGRVFSIWNMLDYELGIVLAAITVWPLPKLVRSRRQGPFVDERT